MNKLRIALSGVGNRALPKRPQDSNWLGWAELVKRSGNFELVAAHDVSKGSLKRIVDAGYLKAEQVYLDLDTMFKENICDAILVCNPAEHHASTIRKALARNLHVLVEKPFVNNLAEGESLVRMIEEKGVVVSVVQNWRYKDVGRLMRRSIDEGMLGNVGHIFFRYVRNRENPNYPKYIFDETLPLLYAMGIHHLDLFRYILKDEYESVSGYSFKPPWSLYRSDTGLNLTFKTKKGATIIYSGTVSSKNSGLLQESMAIEGEKGTLFNESQWLEPPLWFYPDGKRERIDLAGEVKKPSVFDQYNISDGYILENFYRAIIGEEKPACPAADALQSVRALESSRLACETGKTVFLEKI